MTANLEMLTNYVNRRPELRSCVKVNPNHKRNGIIACSLYWMHIYKVI